MIDARKIYEDLKAGVYDDVQRTEDELRAGTRAIVAALRRDMHPHPAAHEVAHLPAPVEVHLDKQHTGMPGLHAIGGHARQNRHYRRAVQHVGQAAADHIFGAPRVHKGDAASHHHHAHQAHHENAVVQPAVEADMKKGGF